MARDCDGHDLSGAQFVLIDDETNAPVPLGSEAGTPHQAYSRFALPDPTCTFTDAEYPAWMLVNAPVNVNADTKTHGYRLRVQGRMRASDREPVVIAEGEVELFSGVTTVIASLPRVYR
jgi:hypothetical protein